MQVLGSRIRGSSEVNLYRGSCQSAVKCHVHRSNTTEQLKCDPQRSICVAVVLSQSSNHAQDTFKDLQLQELDASNEPQPSRSGARFRRPKSVTCDTCGREFTEASIHIHQRKCTKLQQHRIARSPRIEGASTEAKDRARSLEASSPTSTAWVVRSHSADARVQKPKTVPCQFCGKNFLYTSMRVHQNHCPQRQGAPIPSHPARGNSTKRAKSASSRSRDGTPQGKALPDRASSASRRFVSCQICGQLFGTKSIHCHAPRCAKLWEAREAQKPIWERRPVPAWTSDKHLRVNFADDTDVMPRRPRASKTKTTSAACKPPASVVCHLCGRHFSQASVGIHLPRCQKTWEEREATKPRLQRRQVPQAPEAAVGSEEYNQLARKIYQEETKLLLRISLLHILNIHHGNLKSAR